MKRLLATILALFLVADLAQAGAINVQPGTNVQAKINTNPGGTINFADGVYNVPKLMVANVTLSGSVNAVLVGPSGDYVIQLSGDNVTISGMAISGGSGIDFAGHRKNINLSGTVIREGANAGTGIRVLNGLEDCIWQGVTFNHPGNSIGIYNWIDAPPDSSKTNPGAWNAACPATWKNWRVESCVFIGNVNGYVGQTEGAHFRADTPAPPGSDNGPGKSTGGVWRNNVFIGTARCGIEYQGGGTGTLFEGNLFWKPSLSTNRPTNDGSMAYSLAADASVGTIARHNKVVGDGHVSDGVGVRNGFECAGHSVICSDNYVEGVNNAAILNTSTDGVIDFNRFVNNLSGGVVSGSNAVRASIHDNSATQTLTWDSAGSPAVGVIPPPPVTKHLLAVVSAQVSIDGVIDPDTHGVVTVSTPNQTQTNTTGQVFLLTSYNAPRGVWELQPAPITPPPGTQPVVDPIVSVSVKHLSGKVETITP